MTQHPPNARRETFCHERLSEVTSELVLNDIPQAADVKGDHRRAAGLGFDGGVGQIEALAMSRVRTMRANIINGTSEGRYNNSRADASSIGFQRSGSNN